MVFFSLSLPVGTYIVVAEYTRTNKVRSFSRQKSLSYAIAGGYKKVTNQRTRKIPELTQLSLLYEPWGELVWPLL